jgi:hypothetical protein
MMSENALNCLLKFAVGVKHIFLYKSFLTNMILPSLFFFGWAIVLYLSNSKNGEYGAPPGLFYMQQEDELMKRERHLQERLEKSLSLKSSLSRNTLASTAFKTNDPINDTMLNYDDNEELPVFEDLESQPLVRRTLNKEFKSDLGLEETQGYVRRSCPE